MTVITKALSGLVASAGISCAVGLPLSLKTSSTFEGIQDLKISKCDDKSISDSISVGEELSSDICGKVSASGEENSELGGTPQMQDDPQLNEFFKSNGKTNFSEVNYGMGQRECIQSGKGGKLKDSQESKMVGYCGNLDLSNQNTMFIDISKDDTTTHLRICSKGKDCGSDNFNSESISEFKTKDAGEGQDISFFKVQ